MPKKVLEAPTALREVEVVEKGLHNTYDQLRLVGAVIGMQQLLKLALGAQNERDRVSASKELIKLGESPEKIAARLKSAPFADLTVRELEAIVATGIMNPQKALEAYNTTDGDEE